MPIWSYGCKLLIKTQTASHSGADSVTSVRNHSKSKAVVTRCCRGSASGKRSFPRGLTKRIGWTKRYLGSFQERSNQDSDPSFLEIQPSSGSRWFQWNSTLEGKIPKYPKMSFSWGKGESDNWCQYEATFIAIMIRTVTDFFSTLLPKVILLTWFSCLA